MLPYSPPSSNKEGADSPEMTKSLLFPYIYLPNPVLLRHQFLYSGEMIRILSSDRPPRDSKDVKQFIKSADYPSHEVMPENDPLIAKRLVFALEEAYERDNELYAKHIGKFGVERTATKTFHLCRPNEAEAVVEKMQALGFARPDRSGAWIMSTRMMIQLVVTAAVLERQWTESVPRCTGEVPFDELASLLEALPSKDGDNTAIPRAALEFEYVTPESILAEEPELLAKLRDDMPDAAKCLPDTILKAAASLETAADERRIKDRLGEFEELMGDVNGQCAAAIRKHGKRPVKAFGRYRWYPAEGSMIGSIPKERPVNGKTASLTVFETLAGSGTVKEIRSYPGCFIWAAKGAEKKGGFLGRLFSGWR